MKQKSNKPKNTIPKTVNKSKVFDKLEQDFQEQLNRFKDQLKGYEPYELSEIRVIYNKAINNHKKIKDQDAIAKYFILGLEKIDSILKNAKDVYHFLNQKQELDFDSIDFWNEVEQSENLRNQFELMMRELKLSEIEDFDISLEPEIKESSSFVKTSIFEQKTYPEIMNVEEVAEYLRKSPSTIYHMTRKKEIPCQKIGGDNRYDKAEIDEWRRTFKIPKQNNSQLVHEEKTINTVHFIFKIDLEPLTNVFINNEYLDKNNAVLMNDRFSKTPKLAFNKIKWNGEPLSLVTFIYFADRLGFIDKSLTSSTRDHNSTEDEEKEEGEEAKEVQYSKLIKDNFTILGYEQGNIGSTLTRLWNGDKSRNKIGINGEICKLREKIAERKNINEENIKKEMTRKEAIIYYFKNREKKHIKIGQKIDEKMLTIIYDYYNKYCV